MLLNKNFTNLTNIQNDACSNRSPISGTVPPLVPSETSAELRCLAESLQTSRQERNPPLAFLPSSVTLLLPSFITSVSVAVAARYPSLTHF